MSKYLDEFNEHELKQVANGLELRKYPKDRRIFAAGDKAEEMFAIVRGQVAVLFPSAVVYEWQRNKKFDTQVISMR
jgi:CRP-like cAMP-binding protein